MDETIHGPLFPHNFSHILIPGSHGLPRIFQGLLSLRIFLSWILRIATLSCYTVDPSGLISALGRFHTFCQDTVTTSCPNGRTCPTPFRLALYYPPPMFPGILQPPIMPLHLLPLSLMHASAYLSGVLYEFPKVSASVTSSYTMAWIVLGTKQASTSPDLELSHRVRLMIRGSLVNTLYFTRYQDVTLLQSKIVARLYLHRNTWMGLIPPKHCITCDISPLYMHGSYLD